MGCQDDWMLRQIEMITRHVAMMIFHKRAVRYELSSSEMLSETDELHLKLDGLIREGKLCEAEDLLFDNLMFTDPEYRNVAPRIIHYIGSGKPWAELPVPFPARYYLRRYRSEARKLEGYLSESFLRRVDLNADTV